MDQEIKLVGRLGGDPELRYTDSGTAVCAFSMATDKKYKNAKGVLVEETTWWKITTWGKLAEIVNEHKKKGDLVIVRGELRKGKPFQRTQGEHQGEWDYKLEVTADKVVFLFLGGSQVSEAKTTDDVPF